MKRQRGSALFIMIMILVALSILIFMATNIGKSDARIGNAYAEQGRAFIQAETMLARLRYGIEQIPLPEGIQDELSARADVADNIERPIWLTSKLSEQFSPKDNDGEPKFTDPNFAQKDNNYEGWDESNTLTCSELENWMQSYAGISTLDCAGVDPEGKTRTIIELVSRKENKGDIDDTRDTFYYRITIRAEGDSTGAALAQGIAGVRYN